VSWPSDALRAPWGRGQQQQQQGAARTPLAGAGGELLLLLLFPLLLLLLLLSSADRAPAVRGACAATSWLSREADAARTCRITWGTWGTWGGTCPDTGAARAVGAEAHGAHGVAVYVGMLGHVGASLGTRSGGCMGRSG
jgi:hypothetical protein